MTPPRLQQERGGACRQFKNNENYLLAKIIEETE